MPADAMRIAGAVLLSYAAGSIPTAYLIVRWLKRVDVRTIGSGNVGATNAVRAAGAKVGAMVFLLDLLKGVAAVAWIAPAVIPSAGPADRWACGVAAVVGHMFPFALGFRGGKGVATTIGVLVGAAPAVAGIALAGWIACFSLSRYVSLASIAAVAMIPVAQAVRHEPPAAVGWSALLAGLVIAKHHANIACLLDGTEHRWTKERH